MALILTVTPAPKVSVPTLIELAPKDEPESTVSVPPMLTEPAVIAVCTLSPISKSPGPLMRLGLPIGCGMSTQILPPLTVIVPVKLKSEYFKVIVPAPFLRSVPLPAK